MANQQSLSIPAKRKRGQIVPIAGALWLAIRFECLVKPHDALRRRPLKGQTVTCDGKVISYHLI